MILRERAGVDAAVTGPVAVALLGAAAAAAEEEAAGFAAAAAAGAAAVLGFAAAAAGVAAVEAGFLTALEAAGAAATLAEVCEQRRTTAHVTASRGDTSTQGRQLCGARIALCRGLAIILLLLLIDSYLLDVTHGGRRQGAEGSAPNAATAKDQRRRSAWREEEERARGRGRRGRRQRV